MKTGSDSSFVVSWVLILALTVSPVLAQNPQPSNPSDGNPAVFTAGQTAVNDTTTNAVDIDSVPVAALALAPLPLTGLRPALLNVVASPIPAAAPAPASKPAEFEAPGKSKWVILATIIGTAAVVGAILLLRG